jgi:hypothetical protein
VKDTEARACVVFLTIWLLVITIGFAIFIADLRTRTGHLETDVRTLESKQLRAQPQPSCKVNGQTVICHIPGKP